MQLNVVRNLTVRGQSQGLDKVKAELDGVSAAQEGVSRSATGMASATETSARRQLSAANAFERLMERNDRMIYLQRQLEREMNIVNRAHEQGAIDAVRHSQAVDVLQAKYQRLAAAEATARAQITATTGAMDAQASAAHRLAAANDNAGARAGSFNTANVAAQFQDIGVTAAMGQSPLTIALQQGTQLSAVFSTLKTQGQSVGQALFAAFGSIINPLSLVTIGVVGLTAAGIQWASSMVSNAGKADEALERHKKWLDDLLFGYDEAKKAATAAADEAKKLPAGVVESDLRKSLMEQAKAAAEFASSLRRVKNEAADIASTISLGTGISRSVGAPDVAAEDLVRQLETMQQFSVQTSMTSHQIEGLMTTVRELFNTTDNPAIKQLASDFFDLAERVRAAKAETEAQEAALRRVQAIGNINIDISVRSNVDTALSGLDEIKALTPDLRTAYEKVDDALSKVLLANSNLPLTLRQTLDAGARQAAAAAKAALDREAAEREAAKAATATARAIDQQAEAYDNLVKSIEERVAKAEFELTLIGKSADEAARMRIEFELTNQAAGQMPTDKLQQFIEREVKAEKAARDTNQALADRKRLMDQLAGAGTTVVGSLTGAMGLNGTPIGGAINGAMGSLMKGDWVGAIIGGITGAIVGGIEQAQKRQQAIQAANDNKATISGFIGQGYGKAVDETAIALERYRKQAAEYIKLAQAAGDQALVRRLQAAAAAYRDTLRSQQRIERLEDRVEAGRDRLREAYERESSALRDVIQQQTAYVDSLKSFKQSLLLDGNLSPLSPQDRLVQAQMDFQRTSSAALGGDLAAQSRLQDAATSYLEQARNFYASSGAYASIFDQVQSVLDRAIASGTARISDAERQLSVMTDQVSRLVDINTSVVSVATAINKLNADMAKLLAAQLEVAKEAAKAAKQANREVSQSSGKRAA